jgi:hypothetical protein
MQRWFALLFVAMLVVSGIGTRWEGAWEYVIGAPSPLWRCIVSNLQALDRLLLDWGMFPVGIAIGVIGLFLTWEAPRLWGYWQRYDQYGIAFSEAFRDLMHQAARQHFAWPLEHVYKKTSDGFAFRRLIDTVRFPTDSPPRGVQLSDYAHSIRWPNAAGTELYDFMQSVFAGMLSGHSDLITDDTRYERFLDARRITAKFWDDWGRAVAEDRLRYRDVARMFESNKRSIICLAVSELAIAKEFSLDPGEGKSWLFLLAQALTDLDSRHDKRWFNEVARGAKQKGLVRGWKIRRSRSP